MKKNFKYALMAIAALAMVSCNGNDPDKPNRGGEDDDEPSFVSPITLDGQTSDWDALDASKVAVATCPEGALFTGLKSLKVYADEMYINLLVEFDEAQIVDKDWTPFHIYLDADNSNATGGYGDQYADANAEWCLEGPVFSENAPADFNPAVFKWWGEAGTDGWLWTDPSIEPDDSNYWGAIIGTGMGNVGHSASAGNIIEIQILREGMPSGATFAETFGIGVDIQQNWTSCGILPQLPATEDGAQGKAAKLKVTIDRTAE